MQWEVETIRYENNKKVVDKDTVEADGVHMDEHNNAVFFFGTFQEFIDTMKASDFRLLAVIYHSYNYITIKPIHTE